MSDKPRAYSFPSQQKPVDFCDVVVPRETFEALESVKSQVREICGIRFLSDNSVPAGEIHVRSMYGKLLGKIVGLGR